MTKNTTFLVIDEFPARILVRDRHGKQVEIVGALMTAAPELLEACKAALVALNRLDVADRAEYHNSVAIAKLTAALAAIEGQGVEP